MVYPEYKNIGIPHFDKDSIPALFQRFISDYDGGIVQGIEMDEYDNWFHFRENFHRKY
jgi:hypothetical protein